MKRYSIFALALILGCTLFTGCRRPGDPQGMTTTPTGEIMTEMPTVPATMPVTRPATEPSSAAPTEQDTTGATEDNTTAATEDNTTGATEGARRRSGNNRPAMG